MCGRLQLWCCVHVGSTDGEADFVRVPFCARQLFGDHGADRRGHVGGTAYQLNGRKGGFVSGLNIGCRHRVGGLWPEFRQYLKQVAFTFCKR